ncbi:28239_t:CDS:2, partial [Gigaspora margarita]
MSTLANEKYFGYNALISYLKSKKDKSYYGFLSRCREIIAVSTLSVPMPQWQNLNDTWISRFYEAAEEVEPDSISGLREMIRLEHEALNFERYWMGIISEYEKRHEIDHYEATRERLLYELSIIDDKIKTAKEELAEIFNTNNVQSQIDLTSSQNSENEIHTNSGTITDLDFETSNSHQDRERMPTPTRDDINELGIKNLSISKAKKSITTSTQKDNAHNVLELGIETSSTSQADESINTSTQDNDSHNASNTTRINLGVSSTRKGKEKMVSHARENTSDNAIVDLGIGTSNTSQGEPSVQTLIQDDNNQSSNNASIDPMVQLGVGTSSTSQHNNNYASNQLDKTG